MDRRLSFIASALMGLFGLAVSAQGQIEKLPIGSLDELVNYTASNTDRIDIQAVKIVSAANGVSVTPVAEQEFPYSTSQGKLEDFVRQKIRQLLEVGINVKDASLASVKFGVSCLGVNLDKRTGGGTETVLFFAGNNFSLEKKSGGGLAIPVTAFEVNVAGSIAEQELTMFFVPGVKRVQVEVVDSQGQVIETQDSQTHQPGDLTVSVTSDGRGFLLPLKDLMGKAGRITVTYQTASAQIFNLQDGKPLPSAAAEFRQLSETKLTSTGVQFYVTGNTSDVVAIETTTNLETAWTRLGEISSFSKIADKKLLTYPTNSMARGFFRARVVGRKQP